MNNPPEIKFSVLRFTLRCTLGALGKENMHLIQTVGYSQIYPFASHSQEIDQVHSLTLGKIIRLNTGYKSAPDNVFFSTEYCAGVENFQCVPHNETPTGSCENLQRKLWTLQQDLEKSKQTCDAKGSVTDATASIDAIDIVLIVLCVLFFLLAGLFLFLFLRAWLLLRRNLLDNVNAQTDVGLELRNKSKKESEIYQNACGDLIISY